MNIEIGPILAGFLLTGLQLVIAYMTYRKSSRGEKSSVANAAAIQDVKKVTEDTKTVAEGTHAIVNSQRQEMARRIAELEKLLEDERNNNRQRGL